MSPSHTIRNVKENFDWESYLSEHYDVKHVDGKNGPEIRICCPSCGDTQHKCYVNPERRAFYCFKCSFRTGHEYDLFDFVALTEGITKGQALLRVLREYKPLAPDGGTAPFDESEEDNTDRLGRGQSPVTLRFLSGLPDKAYKLTVEDGNPFWEYVKARGFTDAHLAATNLHYVPARQVPVYDSAGKLRGNLGRRILFPVYGPDGQLVSWLGRTIADNDKLPKYFNAPESDLSKTLWPYSTPFSSTVVLVEGIIDALGVRQVGGLSVYATFGKRVSNEQIQVLKHWGVDSVVLWYDKKDACKEMISEVERLKMQFKSVFVLDLRDWPSDKDPGSFLSDPVGIDLIKATLEKKINVYSMDYERWKTSF